MIKRAALARALALDPRVLLLDEPTSGLDPTSADGIDQLIAKLNATLGVTVVVVTHDLNTLFSVCDRVAILTRGKIVVGTPTELLNSKEEGVHEYLSGPRVDYAKAAMSVMPKQNKNEQNKTGQGKAGQSNVNQKTTDQKTIGKDQRHEH
jgi:phospholipid/cholesterol/gamma-HCH transport system ATP-binding protein